MEKLVKVASKLPASRREDGFVDRLSSRYTVVILVLFAVTVGLTAWVRKPMHCWFPKYVTKYQRRYGHSYCWVANTYYLPYSDNIPREHEHDKRRVIRYYQWIPWILLAQAFLFWFPSVIWKQLNTKSGIDSSDIMTSANQLQNIHKLDKREGKLQRISDMFDRFLKTRRADGDSNTCCGGCCTKNVLCSCSGRRLNSYLVVLFIISKIFYLGNIIFQMFVLSKILNVEYQSFGKEYISFYHGHNSTGGDYYRNSPVFPRLSMCDITVRVLGNVQRHTVQCILPLNFYIEKMYLFLWFWLIFLIAATSVDLLLWFFRAVIRKDRLNFVRNHLKAGGYIESGNHQMSVKLFLDRYLKHDGALLLRLIAHNTNTITTSDVIGVLWNNWKDKELIQDGGNLLTDEDIPLSSKDTSHDEKQVEAFKGKDFCV